MGRSPVIYTDQHPYHVTARSNNRDWFDIPMDYCFGIYIKTMEICIQRFHIELYAFVLMNNHFHFIVRTPDKNIGDFLKYFMTQTSKGISTKSNRINHIYGGRNHKNIIYSPEYFAHCIKYVYRNPVKAKICEKVEDYRWSTVSKNKMQKLLHPITTGHDEYIPKSRCLALAWYNTSVPDEMEELLRLAEKRTAFEFKTLQNKKKINIKAGLIDTTHH